jgi:hypothetical protein
VKNNYPKCSCGCQIELTEINGSYLCYRCMKDVNKCVKIVNAMLRTDRKVNR